MRPTIRVVGSFKGAKSYGSVDRRHASGHLRYRLRGRNSAISCEIKTNA